MLCGRFFGSDGRAIKYFGWHGMFSNNRFSYMDYSAANMWAPTGGIGTLGGGDYDVFERNLMEHGGAAVA